ncbi:MAG: hypothetical protein AAFZ65_04150, partial [Planctomycetota bacterium]
FGSRACGVSMRELTTVRLEIALAMQDERELSLVRATLSSAAGAEITALVGFASAALTALSSDPARALVELDRVGQLEERRLEAWRLAYRVLAAGGAELDAQRRALAEFEASDVAATSDEARSAVAILRGKLAYREGDFAASARAFEQAVQVSRRPKLVIAGSLHAASSWLECGQFEHARERADQGLHLAIAHRSPTHEAHARWLVRTIRYRAGGPPEAPSRELVEAVERLGHPALRAQVEFHEAVLAWRGGDCDWARDLARSAADTWRRRGRTVAADLARLLGAEAGAALDPDERRSLTERATAEAEPSLCLQLGALLARAGEPPRVAWLDALGSSTPSERPDRRGDVLSLAEVRAALRPEG